LTGTDELEFTITFDPSTEGDKVAELIIVSSLDDHEFELTGTAIDTGGIVIIEIGNWAGTSGDNTHPFDYWYRNNVSQTIYLADEMQVPGGYIHEITYRFTGAGDVPANDTDVVIYMTNSTKSAFATTTDWLPYAEFDLVYSGPLPVSASGTRDIVITLDEPFFYTGDNLVLLTRRVWGTDYGSGNRWISTGRPLTPNRVITRQSDSINFATPANWGTGGRSNNVTNVKFAILPYVITYPIFDITPKDFAFGEVMFTSEPITNVYSITNIGAETLTIESIAISGANATNFVLGGLAEITFPYEIEEGELEFTITFTPTLPLGDKAAILSIIHDAETESFVENLTAKVVDIRILEFPHLEDFAARPPYWTRWNGNVAANPRVVTEYTDSNWNFPGSESYRNWGLQPFRNVGTNLGMAVNLWQNNQYHWLVSPEIVLTEAGTITLSFDYAMTEYNDSEGVVPDGGHEIRVLVLTDDDFAGDWNLAEKTLIHWEIGGDDMDLVDLMYDGTAHFITRDIELPVGSVWLVFYGQSTSGLTDIMFHIDNVNIEFEPGEALNVTLHDFFFTVTEDHHVTLNWTTASETNMQGFTVIRNDVPDVNTARAISDMITATNTSIFTDYTFIDYDVEAGNTYYYWLAMRSNDSVTRHSNMITVEIDEIEIPVLPAVTKISHVYPNPVRSGTIANFDVEVKAYEVAKLQIFNIRGQLVHEIGEIQPGRARLEWNGRDRNNREVASGVYFYRFTSPSAHSVQRMVVVK